MTAMTATDNIRTIKGAMSHSESQRFEELQRTAGRIRGEIATMEAMLAATEDEMFALAVRARKRLGD